MIMPKKHDKRTKHMVIAITHTPLYNKETIKYDELFNNSNQLSVNNADLITSSPHLNKPLKTIHIYHNIKGETYYVTFSSGVRLAVTYNSELKSGEGIYVIERYIVPNFTGVDVNYMEEYYSSKDLFIDTELFNSVMRIFKTGKDGENGRNIARMVSIINKKEIEDRGSIFVEEAGILLSKRGDGVMYPPTGPKSILSEADGMFYIKINNNMAPGKQYYVRLLDNTHILTATDDEMWDGAYISVCDGKYNSTKFVPISRLETIGIFDMEYKLLENGDCHTRMEAKKYDLAVRQLEVDNGKHNLALKRLGIDDKIMDYDLLKRLIEYRTIVITSEMEIEVKRIALKTIDAKLETEKVKLERARVSGDESTMVHASKSLGLISTVLNGLNSLFG